MAGITSSRSTPSYNGPCELVTSRALGRALMLVRDEEAGDRDRIRALIAQAFAGHPHSDGAEPRIVDALRDAGALTLSLVAMHGERIVGHVAFSPVTIDHHAAPPWY